MILFSFLTNVYVTNILRSQVQQTFQHLEQVFISLKKQTVNFKRQFSNASPAIHLWRNICLQSLALKRRSKKY